MADNITNNFVLVPGVLPPDTCLSQQDYETLIQATQIQVVQNAFVNGVVYSPNTPGPEDQDKLWIRTGQNFGMFYYSIDEAKWLQIYPIVFPDEVVAKEVCYTVEIPAAQDSIPITFNIFGGVDLFYFSGMYLSTTSAAPDKALNIASVYNISDGSAMVQLSKATPAAPEKYFLNFCVKQKTDPPWPGAAVLE